MLGAHPMLGGRAPVEMLRSQTMPLEAVSESDTGEALQTVVGAAELFVAG